MRLYGGQVPIIAEEVLRVLTRSGDLEVTDENMPEVELDIQSVASSRRSCRERRFNRTRKATARQREELSGR